MDGWMFFLILMLSVISVNCFYIKYLEYGYEMCYINKAICLLNTHMSTMGCIPILYLELIYCTFISLSFSSFILLLPDMYILMVSVDISSR